MDCANRQNAHNKSSFDIKPRLSLSISIPYRKNANYWDTSINLPSERVSIYRPHKFQFTVPMIFNLLSAWFQFTVRMNFDLPSAGFQFTVRMAFARVNLPSAEFQFTVRISFNLPSTWFSIYRPHDFNLPSGRISIYRP